MFDSFTEGARHAVSRARWHASRLHHDAIRHEHLVLGVVDVLADSDQTIAGIAGLDLPRFRAQLALRVTPEDHPATTAPLPWTNDALDALTAARCRAGSCEEVDVVRLFLALLERRGDAATIVAAALRAAGAEPQELVTTLALASGEASSPTLILEPVEPRADFEIDFHPELSPAQIAVAVRALGDWFRACGGAGLEFRFAEQYCSERVPEGV